MGNVFSSWWQYLALEGGLYGGAFVISIIVVVVMCCLHKCVVKGEQLILSLYSMVFRFTVKEVVTSELDHGRTKKEYLFGGYKCHPGSWWILHAYFISMFWVIFNLFAISFIDNAFYKKSTVCNDPNSKDDDFLCFDVTKSTTSEAVTCPSDQNEKVICYRAVYAFGNAISLATGLAQFALLTIQVSFLVTLWCVKKCNIKCACGLNWGLLALSAIACIIYFSLVYKIDDWRDVVEINIFYGYKLMSLFKVAWGLATLLLIAIFSPYTWLTDKTNSEETYHLPSYNRDKAKLCNAQNSESDQVTPTTFTPTQNSNVV